MKSKVAAKGKAKGVRFADSDGEDDVDEGFVPKNLSNKILRQVRGALVPLCLVLCGQQLLHANASTRVFQARAQRHEMDMEGSEAAAGGDGKPSAFADAVLADDDGSGDELSVEEGEDDGAIQVRDGFVEADADDVRFRLIMMG